MGGTAIRTLPESIRKLKYLTVLDLHHCKNLRKIPQISNHKEESPESIENLTELKCLDLNRGHKSEFLPSSPCELLHLQKLILAECSSLEELPPLPHVKMIYQYLDIGYEFGFKTSDDRLYKYGDRFHSGFLGATNSDHVFIDSKYLYNSDKNLSDVFGPNWSSICSNITQASFRVFFKDEKDSYVGKIKKVGFRFCNAEYGFEELNVERASSNQPSGHQRDGDSLPHNNSKRIKLMGQYITAWVEVFRRGVSRKKNKLTIEEVVKKIAVPIGRLLRFCLFYRIGQSGLYRDNVMVGTPIVDMYAKCGRMDFARLAFDDSVR
ncbi:hypothetical protein FEM48_Zijuj11G0074200 [Ziziphus jujuba var. spinosa]|uniref:Disease resistance-like protein DSC1 n=1 Tax=Ziziphus jujuba var. spinosa TaxID=714518 RepID=A0A978UHM0_ZIZJJ|nr:hypothetical protein FEM48_Zijuj11G0074200 [Ziziphus jujuba var. spinosa]